MIKKKYHGYEVRIAVDKSVYRHNFYMAEIANCIINDKVPLKEGGVIVLNDEAEYQVGVREIIGLYLLIPFMNNGSKKLAFDEEHTQVAVFDDDEVAFSDINGNQIKIENLRDTICHSFVSCDAPKGKDPVIVFDDRIIMSYGQHKKLEGTEKGSKCILVRNSDVLDFLKKAYERILALM